MNDEDTGRRSGCTLAAALVLLAMASLPAVVFDVIWVVTGR